MKKQTIQILLGLFLTGGIVYAQNQQAPVDQDVPENGVIISNTDSEIVGSLGIGIDIGTPSYGFDTMILRENNLRIYFDDTSNSASFPGNDWGLEANESTNGGKNWFRIIDRTAGTGVFTVEAGAGNNALYIDDAANIGIGTDAPVVEMHMVDGDSPTYRLEQNGSSGFTPQTWDIAGNETNFFIRDVTNGSALPFKIQPGADGDTFHIASTGNVGIGTGSLNAVNDNASLELGANNKGLQLNRLDTVQRTTLGTALGATEVGVIVFDTDDNLVYSWNGTTWEAGEDNQALTLNVNSLDLEDGGSVDLSGYLDNTDDQALTLNVNSLELEDGGTVDLSGYLDNTDDQALTLNVNSLELEDGGTVDLSGYLDNTDDQALTLNVNSLELEDGGTVDLSGYLDNTDDQALTLNVNSLELEDGGTVDLSGYLDNTDDQALTLNGNSLDLEDGGSVDLSGYLDNTDAQNIMGSTLVGTDLTIGISGGTSETVDLSSLMDSGTDDQQLSLTGNSLDLEDGGSVDLSGYLDNTDSQSIGGVINGTDLQLLLTGSTLSTVDMSPLIQPLIDENTAQQTEIDNLVIENTTQQAQIDDLIARIEFLEDLACNLGGDDFNVQPDKAYLFQNIPNPFDNTTEINYFIPLTYTSGNIIISSTTGRILNNLQLAKVGESSITVNKDLMATGVYFYTLFVDGKKVDTKRMVVE